MIERAESYNREYTCVFLAIRLGVTTLGLSPLPSLPLDRRPYTHSLQHSAEEGQPGQADRLSLSFRLSKLPTKAVRLCSNSSTRSSLRAIHLRRHLTRSLTR